MIFRVVFCLEIPFDQIELVNASYVEGRYNISVLRVTKFNRTTHGLTMEIETFRDIDENHSIEVFIYYNRLNNNQYTESPAHIRKVGISKILDRSCEKYSMNHLKNVSNFPQSKTGYILTFNL